MVLGKEKRYPTTHVHSQLVFYINWAASESAKLEGDLVS